MELSNHLNIITGNSKADVMDTLAKVEEFQRNHDIDATVTFYPEKEPDLEKLAQLLHSHAQLPYRRFLIITLSTFVLREFTIMQKEREDLSITYIRTVSDGSVQTSKNLDALGSIKNLDFEVTQADRFIDLINGLKPRTPAES